MSYAMATLRAAQQIEDRRREMQPIEDFVSLQDYEDAIEWLSWVDETDSDMGGRYRLSAAVEVGEITAVGKAWRERAILSLNNKIDADLRDARVPRDQQQFLAMMKKMAHGYQEDAQALKWAAMRLSKKGDLHGAHETQKAAIVAAKAAQELIGEEP